MRTRRLGLEVIIFRETVASLLSRPSLASGSGLAAGPISIFVFTFLRKLEGCPAEEDVNESYRAVHVRSTVSRIFAWCDLKAN